MESPRFRRVLFCAIAFTALLALVPTAQAAGTSTTMVASSFNGGVGTWTNQAGAALTTEAFADDASFAKNPNSGRTLRYVFDNLDPDFAGGTVTAVTLQLDQKISSKDSLDGWDLKAYVGSGTTHFAATVTTAGTSGAWSTLTWNLFPTRTWTVANLDSLEVKATTKAASGGTTGDTWHIDHMTVAVTVNKPPTITQSDANVTEGQSVLLNDTHLAASNPEGGEITYTLTSAPTHGGQLFNDGIGVTLGGTWTQSDVDTGLLAYTHAGGEDAQDTFGFRIADLDNVQRTGLTFTIDVAQVNDAPELDAILPITMDEDGVHTGDANADNAEGGQTLAFNVTQAASDGVAVVVDAALGIFNYTPEADFVGSDSFVVEVCDDGTPALCDDQTVLVTVEEVNDAPVLDPIADLATDEDTDAFGDANATDVDDGDSLTYNATAPANGFVSIDPETGVFTYTPAQDWSGDDAFVVEACDESDACVDTTVNVTVAAVNDAPTGQDDFYTVAEDGTLATFSGADPANETVLYNDFDAENDTVSAILLTSPAHYASFDSFLDVDGGFDYTPEADFFGLDSFTYNLTDGMDESGPFTVWLNVTPVNDAPDLQPIDDLATDEETPVNATADATDAEGDAITFNVTQPANGQALVQPSTGWFAYVPDGDFFGVDSFNVTACDGQACVATTVNVTVSDTPDDPVLDTIGALETDEETLVAGDANATDADDGATWAFGATDGANGTVLIDADTGAFNYTPVADFFGVDAFSVSVCDETDRCDNQTVTVEVANTPDDPVLDLILNLTTEEEVIATDTAFAFDVDEEDLAFNVTAAANGTTAIDAISGNFSYEPLADFVGLDSFTVSVCDPTMACDAQVVWVNVTNVDDTPVLLVNATLETDEEMTVWGDANATDADAGATLAFNATDGANGEVGIDAVTGAFNYTPAPDFFGADNFTVSVCDETLLCSMETVFVTVTNVNDAPVLAAIANLTTEEEVIATDTAFATDMDGDGLVFNVTAAGNGTTDIDAATGNFSYEPAADFVGTDLFTVTACDAGLCDGQVIYVNVTNVDDTPVLLVNTTLETDEETPVWGDANATDSDVGAALAFNATDGANGNVSIDAMTGAFNYTPAPDFFGPDAFTVSVCDETMLCDWATVNVTVTNVNDAPVLAALANVTTEEEVIATDTAAATDADGDVLAYNVTAAANGTTAIDALSGNFSYEPAADFVGTDSFLVTACDAFTCDAQMIHVNVTNVDDTPVLLVNATLETDEEMTVWGDANATDADAGATLAFNATDGANGEVGIDAVTGAFNYTPAPDFFGADNFTVSVCDETLLCSMETVFVTVTNVNDAPVLAAIANLTTEEEVIVTDTAFASDVDQEPLTFHVSAAANGTTGIEAATGNFSYEPAPDFVGMDSFIVGACDPTDDCDSQVVWVNVTNVDDTPVLAVNATLLVQEDANVTAWASATDGDAGATVTFNATDGAIGNVSVDAMTGQLTYTPFPDAFGPDAFLVAACDETLLCDVAQVNVTVENVNDAPVLALLANITLDEDVDYSDAFEAFDADPQDELTFTVTQEPVHASIALNATSGEFVLSSGVVGGDLFAVEVCDGDGACDGQAVAITVLNTAADAPVAVDDVLQANEGEDLVLPAALLGNDYDPDGSNVTVASHSQPTAGNLSIGPDGNLTYSPPDGDFNGNVTFTYTVVDEESAHSGAANVTIVVAPVNDDPSFTAGAASVTRLEDSGAYATAWATDLFEGAADEGSDLLSFNVTPADPALFSGTPTVDADDGELHLTPAANAFGSTVLAIVLEDDAGGQSPPAFVTVTLTAINDAPSFTRGGHIAYSAPDVAYPLLEDTGHATYCTGSACAFPGWATDVSAGPGESGQTVQFVVTNNANSLFAAQPAIAADGNLTFTLAADRNGIATVTVRLQDNGGTANGGVALSAAQTFRIRVTAVNDAPTHNAPADDSITTSATGAQTVDNFVTGTSKGPNEASQGVRYVVEIVDDADGVLGGTPTLAPTSYATTLPSNVGDLTYTATGNVGTATLRFRLEDNGGTANGGDSTGDWTAFSITFA